MGGRKAAHVLIIGNSQTASYHIGIRQPFRELENQGDYKFETKLEWQVTKESLQSVDIIIFFRNIRQQAYQCLEWAHELGKKTVYFIDDNFLAMPHTTGLGLRYADPEIRKICTQFLMNAQTVKLDSSYFAHHIRTHFNGNTVYFPASINFSLLDKLEKPERKDGKIVIGYEGGRKDGAFDYVVPALLKILKKYGDKVKLEFIGYIPPGLKGHKFVSFEKGELDYKRFMKRFYQCTWDIGLAPLENNLFDDCKTNNKFREYAACYVPGIYSTSRAYMDGVVHEETGLFAQPSKNSWYTRIEQMIENPSLREKIKENSHKYVKEHYSLEQCADNWRKHILNV